MRRSTIISHASLWAGGHPLGHPLRPERLKHTWELLEAYHAFDDEQIHIHPPRLPLDAELHTFHTPDYIKLVRNLSRGVVTGNPARYGFGPGDNPIFAGMFESEGIKVGASLVGAELLLADQADVVFNFAGGLHHAGPADAAGFCVFNDIVIAIEKLRQAGLRVAYLDIDAHHGEGVQYAFYDSAEVLTISFHESGLYLFPGTGFIEELGEGEGYGYSVNVPLLPYTGDDMFLWAFDELVPPLLDRFQPDVLVAQLGADAHWQDPLTHLCLSSHGFEALYQRIVKLAPRLLALGGGGYAANVVPRLWTLAWGTMTEQTFANELPASATNGHYPPFLRDEEQPPLSSLQYYQAQSEIGMVVGRLKGLLEL